jgi:glutathione S-transferase
MEYVYLVIALALAEFVVLGAMVGKARGKYGVKAPAVSGPDGFNRIFRVHQNTMEGLVVFVPAIWIFGTTIDPMVAAGLGLIGVIGRAIYAAGYISAADKRAVGAIICQMVSMALVIGAVFGSAQIVLD